MIKDNKYTNYLQTIRWKEIRKFIYAREKGCCANCGSPFNLVVHHLTYDRLGSEDMNDLVLLCKTCHCKLHIIPPEDAETDGNRCFFCNKPTNSYREADLKFLCDECYQLMIENEFSPLPNVW